MLDTAIGLFKSLPFSAATTLLLISMFGMHLYAEQTYVNRSEFDTVVRSSDDARGMLNEIRSQQIEEKIADLVRLMCRASDIDARREFELQISQYAKRYYEINKREPRIPNCERVQ